MWLLAVGVGIGSASAESTDKGVCTVKDTTYRGWQCVEITNGLIDVVVAPELGGRIIQLRLGEAEYLWVNPKLTGKVVRYVTGKVADDPSMAKPVQWANYGGDKLWPAPQGTDGPDEWPGPPDPVSKGGTVDNGSWSCDVVASGPDKAAVKLTSPRDRYAGIRFERRIELHPARTTVSLEATMINAVDRPVRWGIWQVTQHGGHIGRRGRPIEWDRGRTDVRGWSPISADSAYGGGYKIMFGAKDNPQFRRIKAVGGGRRAELFCLDYAYQVGKVGLDNVAGWLAVTHETSKHLFAHTFTPDPGSDQPDGASVEFWASGRGEIVFGGKTVQMSPDEPLLIESEVLSPFAKLAPGQRYAFSSQIHVARGAGPVSHVGSGWAECAGGIRLTPSGGLAGGIAVFQDVRLIVRPSVKGEAIFDKRISAGEWVQLDSLNASVDAKGGVQVSLVDSQGRKLNHWLLRQGKR